MALLVTYPYGTLTLVTLLYLAAIPLSYRRFQQKLRKPVAQPATHRARHAQLPGEEHHADEVPAGETKH